MSGRWLVILAVACTKAEPQSTEEPAPKPVAAPPKDSAAPSDFSIKVTSKHWNERKWYAIAIDARGAVTFTGLQNVDAMGGHQAGTLDADKVVGLARAVDALDFFSLPQTLGPRGSELCKEMSTDGYQTEIEVTATRHHGTVLDYSGCSGSPRLAQLRELEKAVLHAVDLTPWLVDSHEPPPLRQPRIVAESIEPAGAFGSFAYTTMRRCYQEGLARTPDLAGTLVMKMTLAPDAAIAIEQLDGSWADTSVSACFQREMSQARKPLKLADGVFTLRYTLASDPP